MKIAFVTTPSATRSRVGAALRALLPHLRERATRVDLYVAPGVPIDRGLVAGAARAEEPPPRTIAELRLADYDQLVYEVGDEAAHGFMARMLRAVGGTVALHDWALPRLALAARPALAGRGLRARLAAVREGGLREGLAWTALHADRAALPAPEPLGLAGGTTPARAEELADDAAPGEAPLALNRSIVRHGDAFLVPLQDWKQRLLIDRNQHTPIGVVEPAIDGLAAGDEGAWAARAERYLECLATFPQARAARKPLLVAAFRATERGRAERARRARGAPRGD